MLALATISVGWVTATPSPAAAVADDDWLGIVNTYRAMSGLDPVSPNATWSADAVNHSCYMLQNGITHYENPSKPGYTPGGKLAGENGNVAVSSSVYATPRNHIELWMTGPFHAIGIMRHNLRSSGFGLCASANTPTPWHSGGTLDVLRGLDSTPRPGHPITFPGNGATVPLHSFITESPNPLTMCGWSGAAGLPLFVMMPNDVSSASATLDGPSGSIGVCVLHKGNVSDGTARAILDGDNAVIVMPREPLSDGNYSVSVDSNGGGATWSFKVDRHAPLQATTPTPPPVAETQPTSGPARFEPVEPFRFADSRQGLRAVRLGANQTIELQVTSDPNVVAVSANFVSTESTSPGYLTTYNCTSDRPGVSTLGYKPGTSVANQAFVPLSGGKMCVYALQPTDVVIDINGYYRTGAGDGFTPVTPTRLYDTRWAGHTRIGAGEERPLTVAGVPNGAPFGATAVALNLTAIHPDWYGNVRIYPCGSATSNEISSINFSPLEVRANSVVTPVATDGSICITSSTTLDLAIDLTGHFSEGSGRDFQPLVPVRVFDSRLSNTPLNEATGGQPLGAGQVVRLQVAGRQGVPTGATAASVNLTTVELGAPTYVTAFPCGLRPDTSNVNISPGQTVAANGAMVKLSASGELCLYTLNDVHLVVDINGVWL